MSVKNLIPHILDFVHPKSVVEIGCGAGELLEGFQQEGARIQGIDEAEYGEAEFWKENKTFFQPVKLETVRINCQSKFDLAVCLECAHKYSEGRGKSLVHDLCLMSDVVLFSSAIPGQGEDVVNGQMPSYWEKVFRRNGFMMLDCIRGRIWEDEGCEIKYRQNLFICVKEEVLVKYPLLFRCYLSKNKTVFHDAVHPKIWNDNVKKTSEIKLALEERKNKSEITRLLNQARQSFTTKYRVAILCDQKVWGDILAFIDDSQIEVVAYFGVWDYVPESLHDIMKDLFYPIEECFDIIPSLNVEYYITVIPYGRMMSKFYPGFAKLGISKEHILNVSMYFGSERYVGLMYYYQWQYLLKNKSQFDYFITGASGAKMGFDLNTMKPFEGVKLLSNAQDLYYQYKMAEAYLYRCLPDDNRIKFALIEMTPGCLLNLLNDNDVYFNEMFYFPIISHANTEYHNTIRGNLIEKVVNEKSIKWLDSQIKNIKSISWNDRDGQCAAMNLQSIKKWSEAAKDNQVRYICAKKIQAEEVIEFNKYVLGKYVELCERFHIIPIIMLWPYADRIKDNYPKEDIVRIMDVLNEFGKRLHVIDLWKINIPEDYTSDLVHLNNKGAKVITEIIKDYVKRIL